MNEVENHYLENLLNAFIKKPQIVLLQEAESSNPPVTFKEIMEKFTSFRYITPFDFLIEIRCVFASAEDFFVNDPNKLLILKQFSLWFEKKISKLPHNELEEAKLQIKKQLKILNKVSQGISLFSSGIVETGPTYFPPATSIAALQNLILKITDVQTMRQVISIFRRHGIELEPAENIKIPASALSKECVAELTEFLGKATL